MKYYQLLSLLVFCNLLNAQKSVKITYEQKIQYTDAFFTQVPSIDNEDFRAAFRKPKYFELINNGDFSLYRSINLKEEIIASNDVNTATSISKGTFIKPYKIWILKDFKKQSIVASSEVEGKEYYTEKPFSIEELKYNKKVKVIDGYSCLSAYSVSATNDTTQYWYTQEIPVIDGPFFMSTIPGLILSVESKKKQVYAIKIEFFDKKIEFETINKKIPFVTEVDLAKMKQEALKPKSYTDQFGGKHETSHTTIKAGN